MFCTQHLNSGALVLRLMLVGIWLGLHWVLFYFFDHYIQNSGAGRLKFKFSQKAYLVKWAWQIFYSGFFVPNFSKEKNEIKLGIKKPL